MAGRTIQQRGKGGCRVGEGTRAAHLVGLVEEDAALGVGSSQPLDHLVQAAHHLAVL